MSKESPGIMRVFDPFLFLIGHRGAIERIAATPWAFVVGAILVVSAGIARNYDHHLLTQEGIWVIGPFAASLFTTAFIYIWVSNGIGLTKLKDRRGFITFMTLVWMTAPCAWIYGIPVESYTDIVTATKWNIGFLAIVSLWRVILMIRAVCVLTSAPVMRVSLLVMTPAALEMMVGAWNKGMSIVGIMGGVRLSPQDELLLNATNTTASLSFWTFILGVILLFALRGKARQTLSRPAATFPKFAMIPAAICTLIWLLAAMPYQQKLGNQEQLWTLINNEEFEKAAAFAASKERHGFPAAYRLPPDLDWAGFGRMALLEQDLPDWLREEWTNNALEDLKSPASLRQVFNGVLESTDPRKLKRQNPEIVEGLRQYAEQLRNLESRDSEQEQWLEYYEPLKGEFYGP